jgi:hypothetical protein
MVGRLQDENHRQAGGSAAAVRPGRVANLFKDRMREWQTLGIIPTSNLSRGNCDAFRT